MSAMYFVVSVYKNTVIIACLCTLYTVQSEREKGLKIKEEGPKSRCQGKETKEGRQGKSAKERVLRNCCQA